MKTFRVFYIKKGTKLTKLVYADTLQEAKAKFKGMQILQIKEIDTSPQEDLNLSLNSFSAKTNPSSKDFSS